MASQVDWYWPTSIVVEDVSERIHGLGLAHISPASSSFRVNDVSALAEIAEEISSSLVADKLDWTATCRTLNAGEYQSPTYDASDIQVHLVIEKANCANENDSGLFMILDPRPGIQNVFVPGMPWNSSISMRSNVGFLLAGPGWLATMVTPLAEGDSVTWLHLQGWKKTPTSY